MQGSIGSSVGGGVEVGSSPHPCREAAVSSWVNEEIITGRTSGLHQRFALNAEGTRSACPLRWPGT